jgi:hypothetical protein
MAKTSTRPRYFEFPYQREVFDARLERLAEVRGQRGDLTILVDLLGLRPLGEPAISLEEGRPWESLRAEIVPLRLRFTRARWVACTGVYENLKALSADHRARRLFDVFHVRLPGQRPAYWFFTDFASEQNMLAVRAAGCVLEERPGQPQQVEVRRRWARRPPTRTGLIPKPAALHRRFGGDPVAIRLGRRVYRHRLFIGGLAQQSAARPLVDHVLNLCGDPNPWQATHGIHPADRCVRKGEMHASMHPEELVAEAAWVVERLRDGRRVLVHCAGGINRSSTICCATLMLLEGLSADQALERLQERHPEADPDPYHWFVLRWLGTRAAAGLEPASSAHPTSVDAPRPLAVIR